MIQRFGLSDVIFVSLLLFLPCLALGVNLSGDHDKTEQSKRDNSHINIDITTHLGDKQTFLEGDTLSFLINLDRDAYLLVIYEDAAGNLIQILPNSILDVQRYKAGLFITIPDPRSNYRFTVQAPFGQERLWVFASDVPPPELQGKHLKDGLKQLKFDIATIKRQFLDHPKATFGEASLLILTKSRD